MEVESGIPNYELTKETKKGSDDATGWVPQTYVTEDSLKNDHLVGTDQTLFMEYKINVEVMATLIVDGTLGNVICFRNYNEPQLLGGIWFRDDRDTFTISVDMKVNGKSFIYNTSREYLPGIWQKLEIMQRLDNSSYIYSITINDELVHSTINRKPNVFTGLNVYAAYNNQKSGFIRNLIVYSRADEIKYLSSPAEMQLQQTSASTTSRSLSTDMQTSLNTTTGGDDATGWVPQKYITEDSLKDDHLIGTDQVIGMEYKFNVEVKATQFVEGILANVICFRSDNMAVLFGGIWFHNIKDTGKIEICMKVNGELFTHNTQTEYLPDIWHKLEVMQRLDDSSYIYSILINNELVYSTINRQPEVFTGVNVFAAYSISQSGFIRNFVVYGRAGKPMDTEETQLKQIASSSHSRSLSTSPDHKRRRSRYLSTAPGNERRRSRYLSTAPDHKRRRSRYLSTAPDHKRRRSRPLPTAAAARERRRNDYAIYQKYGYTAAMLERVKTFNPDMATKEQGIPFLLYKNVCKARRIFFGTENHGYYAFLRAFKDSGISITNDGFTDYVSTATTRRNASYHKMVFNGWLRNQREVPLH